MVFAFVVVFKSCALALSLHTYRNLYFITIYGKQSICYKLFTVVHKMNFFLYSQIPVIWIFKSLLFQEKAKMKLEKIVLMLLCRHLFFKMMCLQPLTLHWYNINLFLLLSKSI